VFNSLNSDDLATALQQQLKDLKVGPGHLEPVWIEANG